MGSLYELYKLTSPKSRGLIPKKVPIKSNLGRISYGIRWVKPSGESGTKKYSKDDFVSSVSSNIKEIQEANKRLGFDIVDFIKDGYSLPDKGFKLKRKKNPNIKRTTEWKNGIIGESESFSFSSTLPFSPSFFLGNL